MEKDIYFIYMFKIDPKKSLAESTTSMDLSDRVLYGAIVAAASDDFVLDISRVSFLLVAACCFLLDLNLDLSKIQKPLVEQIGEVQTGFWVVLVSVCHCKEIQILLIHNHASRDLTVIPRVLFH